MCFRQLKFKGRKRKIKSIDHYNLVPISTLPSTPLFLFLFLFVINPFILRVKVMPIRKKEGVNVPCLTLSPLYPFLRWQNIFHLPKSLLSPLTFFENKHIVDKQGKKDWSWSSTTCFMITSIKLLTSHTHTWKHWYPMHVN